MGDLEITTGWLNETEISEVVNLRKMISKHPEYIRKYRTPSFYKWKYYNNPLGKSWIRVARYQSRVIGMLTASPRVILAKGKKLKAAELSDGFVHPDFQKQGIFTRLGKELFEYLDTLSVELTYGLPNDKSLPGLRRMGFEIASYLQTYRRPLKPEVLEAVRPISMFPYMLRPVLANLFFNFWPKVHMSSGINIIESISQIMDRLEVLPDDTSIKLSYEEAYAKWRYQEFPFQIQVINVVNPITDQLLGWVAVCVLDTPENSSPVAHILHVSTFIQDINTVVNLIQTALKIGHDQGAISATVIIPSPVSTIDILLLQALRRLRFVKRGKPNYFIVRLSQTSSLTWNDVSQPGIWRFELGDTDGL